MSDVYLSSLDTTPIGITNFRNSSRPFGIKDKDRLGHIYAVGKTGTGKSTLLMNMAISDLRRGNGLAIIDPHGDIATGLMAQVPENRRKDFIYINPSETERIVAFNPLHAVDPEFHHLVASGIIGTLKKIWAESWGPRMEHILRFALLALLEYPNATLLDIQPFLTDQGFRNHVLAFTKNEPTIAFWMYEFGKYSPHLKAEAVAPILNKVGLFASSSPLRNMFGNNTTDFRMQNILDGGKILIANLSKGIIGEDASALIGSMLVTSIQLAAMYRARMPENTRRPFYLYVDEAHSFLSESFADILSEARKYGLSLFITHQFIEQMPEKIRTAIFGNVGTMIAFRVGANDAEYLAREFKPLIEESDLVTLPRYHMYIKLMIDGATSLPFSAETLKTRKTSPTL